MARFNGQNFALCGKTIASLRRNVVGVLKQMLTARGYTAAERRGDNLLIVTRGTVTNDYYLFGGKDEGSQDLIQGITLAGALFDEVALMPESFVNRPSAAVLWTVPSSGSTATRRGRSTGSTKAGFCRPAPRTCCTCTLRWMTT